MIKHNKEKNRHKNIYQEKTFFFKYRNNKEILKAGVIDKRIERLMNIIKDSKINFQVIPQSDQEKVLGECK